MFKKIVHFLHTRTTKSDSALAAFEHPAFARTATLIAEQNWQDLEAHYNALPFEERHFVLSGAAEIGPADGWYDEWLATNSTTAKVFLASTLIVDAWKARSGMRAQWVSASQSNKFHDFLSRAFDLLMEAHEQDPSDPEPVTRLIRVMMGLQSRQDQYYDAFERVESTGAQHLGAGWYMIDALSPKWGGTQQGMLSFARTLSAKQNQFAALIPLAHTEIWVYLDMFEKNETKAAAYFQEPEVKEEILSAYEIHKELQTDGYFDLLTRNAFAFALWKMGEKLPASHELEFIGRRVAAKPWGYVHGNPISAVNEAREALGGYRL